MRAISALIFGKLWSLVKLKASMVMSRPRMLSCSLATRTKRLSSWNMSARSKKLPVNRNSSGTVSSPGTAAAPAEFARELPPERPDEPPPTGALPSLDAEAWALVSGEAFWLRPRLIRASRAMFRALGRLTGARLCLGSVGSHRLRRRGAALRAGAARPRSVPRRGRDTRAHGDSAEVDVGPAGGPLELDEHARHVTSVGTAEADHGRVVGREGLFGCAELLLSAASSRLGFMPRKA